MQYYTPPQDSRRAVINNSTLHGQNNKNIEIPIENKTNNYNTNRDNENILDNFKCKLNK